VEEPEQGFMISMACRACEWRSERTFTGWDKYSEGLDVEGYLNRPPEGPLDRLYRRGADLVCCN
jgi:hypothetical protein